MKYIKECYLAIFLFSMAYLAHLKWWLLLPIGIGSLVYVYCSIRIGRRKAEGMERLEEGVFYQEQLIASFRRNQKIPNALRDTREVCQGRLELMLGQALLVIEKSWMEEDYLKQAFAGLEAVYGSGPMRQLHRFLIHVEEWGGESSGALDLFLLQLRSYKNWQTRLALRMEDQLRKLNLTIILSGIICLAIPKVIPDQLQNLDAAFYQWTMGLTILGLMLVSFYFLFHLRWDTLTGKEKRKDYDKLWHRISQSNHGLSYEHAKGLLEKAVKKSFPDWLMDMLLRLQTENVASAIAHSIDTAPDVLVIPLCRLAEEQKADALSKDPFMHFLQELDLPEIRAIMLQLFAIRNLGKQEIQDQILAMLEAGRRMEESGEELRMADYFSWNGLLAAIPMAITVALMMGYMSFTLLGFLRHIADGRWL